jgi:hypothetical protein
LRGSAQQVLLVVFKSTQDSAQIMTDKNPQTVKEEMMENADYDASTYEKYDPAYYAEQVSNGTVEKLNKAGSTKETAVVLDTPPSSPAEDEVADTPQASQEGEGGAARAQTLEECRFYRRPRRDGGEPPIPPEPRPASRLIFGMGNLQRFPAPAAAAPAAADDAAAAADFAAVDNAPAAANAAPAAADAAPSAADAAPAAADAAPAAADDAIKLDEKEKEKEAKKNKGLFWCSIDCPYADADGYALACDPDWNPQHDQCGRPDIRFCFGCQRDLDTAKAQKKLNAAESAGGAARATAAPSAPARVTATPSAPARVTAMPSAPATPAVAAVVPQASITKTGRWVKQAMETQQKADAQAAGRTKRAAANLEREALQNHAAALKAITEANAEKLSRLQAEAQLQAASVAATEAEKLAKDAAAAALAELLEQHAAQRTEMLLENERLRSTLARLEALQKAADSAGKQKAADSAGKQDAGDGLQASAEDDDAEWEQLPGGEDEGGPSDRALGGAAKKKSKKPKRRLIYDDDDDDEVWDHEIVRDDAESPIGPKKKPQRKILQSERSNDDDSEPHVFFGELQSSDWYDDAAWEGVHYEYDKQKRKRKDPTECFVGDGLVNDRVTSDRNGVDHLMFMSSAGQNPRRHILGMPLDRTNDTFVQAHEELVLQLVDMLQIPVEHATEMASDPSMLHHFVADMAKQDRDERKRKREEGDGGADA